MTRWWSVASIRTRLTAWYSVSMFLMLVIYAAATYGAVRHEFFEQLDGQLDDDFETVERSASPLPDGHFTMPTDVTQDPDADSASEHGSEVWSPAGQPLFRSAPALDLPAISADPRSTRQYESIVANGRSWRTLVGAVRIGDRNVVLRVSRAEERPREQLHEVLVVLIFGLPLVVALAGIGGYLLARHALSPIDQLATAARRITAARLHERVSVANEHDEIGQLATIINDTFARLESSFEQLRRFTADASHELRTPLSVIRGTGEAALTGSRTPAEYREAMGSMLEEVDRLTNLVEALLRLSHADAGRVQIRREPVDLGTLARDAAGSLGLLAEERRQQVRVNTAGAVVVDVDRMLLREAVTNVLDNAIKYSPPSSVIDVQVAQSNGHGVLRIADEGPGIPDTQRERVFDRFFRLDEDRSREHGGMGLGLSIAKWAVEVNGGRISVDPNEPHGSVFCIVLPATSTARRNTAENAPRHQTEEVS
jgi:heavy metal sensor kinase